MLILFVILVAKWNVIYHFVFFLLLNPKNWCHVLIIFDFKDFFFFLCIFSFTYAVLLFYLPVPQLQNDRQNIYSIIFFYIIERKTLWLNNKYLCPVYQTLLVEIPLKYLLMNFRLNKIFSLIFDHIWSLVILLII